LKKLAAIVLLLLMLFNLAGYRLWFYCAQQQADARLNAALDHDLYNDDELITIKIPLSMPYQTDRAEFERVNGEVNLNGKIYKYVKRRVAQGQLVLLCLPDHQKMRIESAKDEFFKLCNSLASGTPVKKPAGSNAAVAFNILSDYDSTPHEWLLHALVVLIKNKAAQKENYLTTRSIHPLERPPKYA